VSTLLVTLSFKFFTYMLYHLSKRYTATPNSYLRLIFIRQVEHDCLKRDFLWRQTCASTWKPGTWFIAPQIIGLFGRSSTFRTFN